MFSGLVGLGLRLGMSSKGRGEGKVVKRGMDTEWKEKGTGYLFFSLQLEQEERVYMGPMVYSVTELSEAREKIQLPCP